MLRTDSSIFRHTNSTHTSRWFDRRQASPPSLDIFAKSLRPAMAGRLSEDLGVPFLAMRVLPAALGCPTQYSRHLDAAPGGELPNNLGILSGPRQPSSFHVGELQVARSLMQRFPIQVTKHKSSPPALVIVITARPPHRHQHRHRHFIMAKQRQSHELSSSLELPNIIPPLQPGPCRSASLRRDSPLRTMAPLPLMTSNSPGKLGVLYLEALRAGAMDTCRIPRTPAKRALEAP